MGAFLFSYTLWATRGSYDLVMPVLSAILFFHGVAMLTAGITMLTAGSIAKNRYAAKFYRLKREQKFILDGIHLTAGPHQPLGVVASFRF